MPRGRDEPGLELGLELLIGPVVLGAIIVAVTRYGPRISAWIISRLGGEEPTDLNIAPSRPRRMPKAKAKPQTPTSMRTVKALTPPPSRQPTSANGAGASSGATAASETTSDSGLKSNARVVADGETVDTATALQETVEWSEVTGKRARAQRKAGKTAKTAEAEVAVEGDGAEAYGTA